MKKSSLDNMKVFVMDLLCMTPYYDTPLCAALADIVPDTRLAAITFHLDRDYFSKEGVLRQKGMVDVVGKLSIPYPRVRRFLKLLEYLVNLLLLSIMYLAKPPAVVHVQWIPLVGLFPFELWFLRLLQRRGAKLVYTVHNVLPHDTGDRYRLLYAKIYAMMDLLICHTRQSREEVVQQFSVAREKTAVIPHGALFNDAPQVTSAEARSRLGIAGDATAVLFFGTVRPYKGIEFLLDAWQMVTSQVENAVLLIAGNGDAAYLASLRERIERGGLGGTVVPSLRFIPSEELPLFYQAADILVYPYKDITQSGALLTGMTFGKPIVATAVGGIEETLRHGENSLLVPYGDTAELAAALSTLIATPQERSRLGAAVRADLERNHSWQQIAEETVRCYREILSR